MYLSLSAGVVGHTCICPGSLKKLNILPLAAGTKSQAEHNSAVQRAVWSQQVPAKTLSPPVRPAPADCAWLQPPPAASRVRAHASSTAGHSRPEDQYQHGPLLGLFPKVQLFDLFLIYLLFSLRTLLYSYNRPFDSVAPCFFCLETRL